MDITKLKRTFEKARDLSLNLYQNQHTFFIGAGFSKNISGMPDFRELVRNRILTKYFSDFVNDREDNIKEFLETREFQPKNCINCFISSYRATHPANKESWVEKISCVELRNGHVRTLRDCVVESKRLFESQKKVDKKILDCLNTILTQTVLEKEEINLLTECAGKFQANEFTQCLKCVNAYWDVEKIDETRFILGLIQSYLDNGVFQFSYLLELIRNAKKKRRFAEYAFYDNDSFKGFNELIMEYHKQPFKRIGDSQIVLARLAKEGLLHHVITTNWDDLIELACYAIDMYVKTSDGEVYGRVGEKLPKDLGQLELILEHKNYVNHAVAISEKEDFYKSRKSLAPTKRTFYIYKIHGGIDTILKEIHSPSEKAQDDKNFTTNMVITHRDLIDWRHDTWSEQQVNSILRSHDIVFLGISGQDNVVYATVRKLMEEINAVFNDISYDQETSQKIKQIFAVNIQQELALKNMIQAEGAVTSEPIIIDRSVEYNGRSSTDLFYRWFYVFHIINNYKANEGTYLRKAVEYVNIGESVFSEYIEYRDLMKEFIEKLFDSGEECFDLKLHYLDIFFDVIPKSLIYTWLINNKLSSILSETGGTSLLLNKPHFYLPVFSYSKWFTMYLIIFAVVFKLLRNSKYSLTVTNDGMIIINGVALIFMIERENADWNNLFRAVVLDFSQDTIQKLNRCRRKVILSWYVSDKVQLKDVSVCEKFFISRNFEYQRFCYQDLSSKLELILR